jgi:hypothetical protein
VEAKELFAREVRHVVITTKVHANRMATRQEGNTGKYAGGGVASGLRVIFVRGDSKACFVFKFRVLK